LSSQRPARESCRRHGVEPYTYLRDLLTRLPTMTNRQIKDIVPKAWPASSRTAATCKKPLPLAAEPVLKTAIRPSKFHHIPLHS
jgi:hypothetical protein